MATTKSKYWAVKKQTMTLFTGTFIECWDYLGDHFPDWTFAEAKKFQLRVTRAK